MFSLKFFGFNTRIRRSRAFSRFENTKQLTKTRSFETFRIRFSYRDFGEKKKKHPLTRPAVERNHDRAFYGRCARFFLFRLRTSNTVRRKFLSRRAFCRFQKRQTLIISYTGRNGTVNLGTRIQYVHRVRNTRHRPRFIGIAHYCRYYFSKRSGNGFAKRFIGVKTVLRSVDPPPPPQPAHSTRVRVISRGMGPYRRFTAEDSGSFSSS